MVSIIYRNLLLQQKLQSYQQFDYVRKSPRALVLYFMLLSNYQDINSARTVFEQKYTGENLTNIDISNSPEGVYTVQVIFDDNAVISKTIVKK